MHEHANRYCTGYLGDIGVPLDPPWISAPGSRSISATAGYTFDARHNEPRIGRILIARGRDATDVAITTSYGPHQLAEFKVVTDEVVPGDAANPSSPAVVRS